MKFTATQIAGILEGDIVGNPDVEVSKLAKIEEGTKGSLTFLANPKYTPYIYSTKLRKDHICERVDLGIDDVDGIITNNKYVPAVFAIQMQIPSEPPPSVFSTVEDGPGWAIVMYFKITQDTCDQLKDLSTASAAVKLFQKYCEYGEKDKAWRARFKVSIL